MTEMLDAPIREAGAWCRADIRTGDFLVPLSADCLAEIERTVERLRAHPLPTILLEPDMFELPACRAVMARVRAILADGVRFAIVDRLPMDRLALEEAKAVYWLLATLVARPVAQSMDATMIYDVHDTGRISTPGSGIRRDKTSAEINFHNDNSYNHSPPDVVALLCVRPAAEGGHSRVASFLTAHNRLRESRPELLARLYAPFWFDRQREFLPGEPPVFAAPVFETEAGRLRGRFSVHQIHAGYKLRGESPDPAGAAALDAMREILSEDALSWDFDLQAGQMQFVANRAVGHSRTAFADDADPARRRHLVRLWLRDRGSRAYPG